MKQTLTADMRFGKVAFQISWDFDFPLDLKAPENKAMAETMARAFETVKTDLAAKAKKAYAKALDIRSSAFKTEMADDVIEAEKHWKEAVKGSEYKVSNFKEWTPQSEGQISVAKVLAWLQSLPAEMPLSEVVSADMTSEELKAEILK